MLKLTTYVDILNRYVQLLELEIFVTKCTEADDITKDDKSSGWYSAMYI